MPHTDENCKTACYCPHFEPQLRFSRSCSTTRVFYVDRADAVRHGMEEVIGSIPIRSTNPLINSYLAAPASLFQRLQTVPTRDERLFSRMLLGLRALVPLNVLTERGDPDRRRRTIAGAGMFSRQPLHWTTTRFELSGPGNMETSIGKQTTNVIHSHRPVEFDSFPRISRVWIHA
jgi:hypothetical protein